MVVILCIVNDCMVGALCLVSLLRGYDLCDFVLFVFGGVGSLYVSVLAKELGIFRFLVLVCLGIINALGCLVVDVCHDYVNMVNV